MIEVICLAASPLVYDNVSTVNVQMQNPIILFFIQLSAVIVGGLITLWISNRQQKKSFEAQQALQQKSFEAQQALQQESFKVQNDLQKENSKVQTDLQEKNLMMQVALQKRIFDRQDEEYKKRQYEAAQIELLKAYHDYSLDKVNREDLIYPLKIAAAYGPPDFKKAATLIIKDISPEEGELLEAAFTGQIPPMAEIIAKAEEVAKSRQQSQK